MSYPRLLQNAIDQLSKLPNVGKRSAERMVYWILDHDSHEIEALANSILKLKEGLGFCRNCFNLTEAELCPICEDKSRDVTIICIVETAKDLIAIEKSGAYIGRYYVLWGTISPAEGRGPQDLKIKPLFERIKECGIKEVIIATDPDNEGEMTALYLMKQLKPMNVKVSRIGLGIPVGSAVEYADISTLNMSMNSRRVMTE